jgi:hypothetical protein
LIATYSRIGGLIPLLGHPPGKKLMGGMGAPVLADVLWPSIARTPGAVGILTIPLLHVFPSLYGMTLVMTRRMFS